MHAALLCHAQGIRVPKPYAVDASGDVVGTPFMLVSFVPGNIIGDFLVVYQPSREVALSIVNPREITDREGRDWIILPQEIFDDWNDFLSDSLCIRKLPSRFILFEISHHSLYFISVRQDHLDSGPVAQSHRVHDVVGLLGKPASIDGDDSRSRRMPQRHIDQHHTLGLKSRDDGKARTVLVDRPSDEIFGAEKGKLIGGGEGLVQASVYFAVACLAVNAVQRSRERRQVEWL